MRIHLMFRDRPFTLEGAEPYNAGKLTEDLDLGPIVRAMAGGDGFVEKVALSALVSGCGDAETVVYRQGALKDVLANPEPVRQAYTALTACVEEARRRAFWITTPKPSSVLLDSVVALKVYLDAVDRVREIFAASANSFTSEAFRALLAAFQQYFEREYTDTLRSHLAELEFPRGVEVEVGLGGEAELADFTPLRPRKRGLREALLGGPRYTWRLPERDEAGAEELENMRNMALERVARAAGRAAQHVLEFVQSLRAELAFYVGCLNLHQKLREIGVPLCFPVPRGPDNTPRLSFSQLVEASLALRTGSRPVPNSLEADGKPIVVVSGANRGGKTVFLRSIGQAQLMMMAGMFVAAERYESSITRAVHTHFKRGEDVAMKLGRLEEELSRLGEIVDHVKPGDLVLLNESFSSTNEWEGSRLAQELLSALAERGVRVVFVTHFYEIQGWLAANRREQTVFLVAERREDGARTYRIVLGGPSHTSFAEDVYKKVFGE